MGHPDCMENRKRNLLIAVSLNFLLLVLECIGVALSAAESGAGMFRYYTLDSNVMAAIGSLLFVITGLLSLKKGEEVPSWVKGIRLMSTSVLMVTFLVVLLVLAPFYDPAFGFIGIFTNGSMLYHHLLCPLLSLVSFLIFERTPVISRTWVRWSLVPTIVYALIAAILNITRVMSGPYPFLHVYEQPVWLSILWTVVILSGAFAISWFTLRLNQKSPKKQAAQAAR